MGNLTDIGHGIGKYLTASDATGIPQIDDNAVDLANLHFKLATNNNFVKYNMVDGFFDAFQDTSGVDAGNSTNEIRDGTGEYYSGIDTLIAATGGTITTYGDYTIHTFLTGADYVSHGTQSVDVLVVAGGGSGGGGHDGGNGAGGGGGAGGMIASSAYSLAAGTHAITVGAGATASDGVQTQGTNGVNSQVGSISALEADGGGGGASGASPPPASNSIGLTGGSGGGSARGNTVGSGTSGQGNAGGLGVASGGGGAGGGKGAVGGAGSGNTAGSGGAGTANSYRTNSGVTYAAGANGGPSSAGRVDASDATANTGNGGGGGSDSEGRGGNGGSGIVVIKRLTTDTGPAALTLVSNTQTAATAPSRARLCIFEHAATGTTTINTDIKGWVSRDNGSNYDQITLVSQSEYESGKRMLSGSVDFTMASGTNMRYKITTHNQSSTKITRVHGASMLWS